MDEQKYPIQYVPMVEIFSDESFNCRGHINPMDCVDLANDIKAHGLDFPITVVPYTEKKPYKFKIVAGHRRHIAFRINETPKIPCIIRADLDEYGAAGLNLRENIQRKDLNIMQEANGLRRFFMGGWSEGSLATFLNQSRGWVQVRYMLIQLPPDIQKEAAAGFITQDQIRKLNKLPTGSDQQYALVRAIKLAKIQGEKVEIKDEKERDVLKTSKKCQDRGLIFAKIDHLLQLTGSSLTTRAMAWCAGEISDYELHRAIEDECKKLNIPYDIPIEIQNAFKDKGAA